MTTQRAACHWGQLRLEATSDPFVMSICHYLACQWRTGSAFGMQAAFRREQVEVSGRSRTSACSSNHNACRSLLAGETDGAHLARSLQLWDGCRGLAQDDSDFGPIRDDPCFVKLVQG